MSAVTSLPTATVTFDDDLVLVPDGEYELAVVEWETKKIFKSEKLYLKFRVVTPGEYFGRVIPMYFNVEIVGKPSKNGHFKVRGKGDFARMFAEVFGWSGRPDRLPMSRLENRVLVGAVRTVTKGRDQRDIPKPCRYSVVDRILRVQA